jgi:hypothetical protein
MDVVSIHGILLSQAPLVAPVPKALTIHLFGFFSIEILLNAPDASTSLQSYVKMLQNVKLFDQYFPAATDTIEVEN